MLEKNMLKVSDIVLSLSNSLDLSTKFVFNHSCRVAYISLKLSQKIGLTEKKIDRILLAALLHDIGMIRDDIKLEAISDIEIGSELLNKHCTRGYKELKGIKLFTKISPIIYSHHDRWKGNNQSQLQGEGIPLASRIIHLADRIEILIDRNEYILSQVDGIRDIIRQYSGDLFDPYLVKIFITVSNIESFWLHLQYGDYNNVIKDWSENTKKIVTLAEFEEIAHLFADIIDRKSPFTRRHSRGVAETAIRLSGNMGFNDQEQRVIYIAGLLHDLGKMAIPDYILKSKDRLSNKEIKIIKQHTYHTFQLLNQINGLGVIPKWAAYHHEKLDGSGYPFHLTGKDMDTGSRIMAVSDIYQALTEERPYRDPLPDDEVLNILYKIGNSGKLDLKVIAALKDLL